MQFLVIDETLTIITSYSSPNCLSNVELAPITRKRPSMADGKVVWEEFLQPHPVTNYQTSNYTHMPLPEALSGHPIEDLVIQDGEVVLGEEAKLVQKFDFWSGIREKRNALLSACDWTMLRDVPHSLSWEDYRQSLRDLPQSSMSNLAWPLPPSN
jgi:hypothetical protein